ncbi:MAG: heavy metal translocating P-type ATPase [Polyangiaceae bacterium]
MNKPAASSCFHCGLPVLSGRQFQAVVLDEPRLFCCAGCQAVAEAIAANGLASYYLDRDSNPENPAALPQTPASLLGYDHPSAQKEFLLHEEGFAVCELTLENLSCAACAWLVEKNLQQQSGVAQASVNLSNHRLHLRWNEAEVKLSQLLWSLERIGYRARPWRADSHLAQLQQEGRDLLKRLAVAGFGMMQVMMYAGSLYVGSYQGIEAEYRDYLNWINLLITTPVFFYSGWPFYRSAWRALRARRLNMDVPVSLAVIAAYVASVFAVVLGHSETWFDSVTMFIFFLLCSHYLEARARQRAGDTAAGLMALTPQLATRLGADLQTQEVIAACDLVTGDAVLVRPGETVPADGEVLQGSSMISEALLTGEPLPLSKEPGTTVTSGSLNHDETLVIRINRPAAQSTLGTLNRLLNRALAEKPKLAGRADELAQIFVAATLVLSLIVFASWAWFSTWQQAFWITLSVLVATCPCALSLATPLALGCATNTLAEKGFLITRGHVLETLNSVSHAIFDKTGTLTTGDITIASSTVLRGSENTALQLAATLEQQSRHPVARAFQTRATDQGVKLLPVQQLQSINATGVCGEVGGKEYRLGQAWFALGENAGNSERDHIWLADAEGPIASFRLQDALRPEAHTAIAILQTEGMQTWLLSGDPSSAVNTIGRELGMQQMRGGLSPEEKLQTVKALQQDGAIVMMVGDGVNDAPVLAQAHLSLAMASGTDLALVTADALLLRNDLRHIALARAMAEKTRRIIKQNLAWALAYNLAILPPAALGWLPPWMAALGMSLSSLVVVLNALSLRKPPAQENA